MARGLSDGSFRMVAPRLQPLPAPAVRAGLHRLDVRANLLDSGWSMGISGTVKQ